MTALKLVAQPSDEGRVPASDLASEAAILTACMNKPSVAALAMSIASPGDYYSGAHQVIAQAIVDLLEAGVAPATGAVLLRLRDTDRLRVAGGDREMVEMMNGVPAVQNMVGRYAARVRDLARVRRLGDAMRALLAEAYQPVPDVPAFLARADATIGDVTRTGHGQRVTSVLDAAKELARELAKPRQPIVTTGFRALDELTHGFEAGALYILGARTSMGKTAIALQMAAAAAAAGTPVLVSSMEMPHAQLVRRLVCARSGVPMRAVKAGNLSDAQWSAWMSASSDIAQLPIHIADGSGQTLLDIKAAARARTPGLLVVDHIGLMHAATGDTGARRSREQEVAGFSRGLKALAIEMNIPVLALCQVGRDAAKGGRRPVLTDLRESGAIEQDADGVWLVHRPGYYDAHASPEVMREAELAVAKQRDGELGVIPLEWDAGSATFREGPR